MAMFNKVNRHLLANLIGAEIDEVVLVPNTTHGINTILRNFEWKEGDILLCSTKTFSTFIRRM